MDPRFKIIIHKSFRENDKNGYLARSLLNLLGIREIVAIDLEHPDRCLLGGNEDNVEVWEISNLDQSLFEINGDQICMELLKFRQRQQFHFDMFLFRNNPTFELELNRDRHYNVILQYDKDVEEYEPVIVYMKYSCRIVANQSNVRQRKL